MDAGCAQRESDHVGDYLGRGVLGITRGLLAPLSFVYAAVISARNQYFDRVARASHDAGLPVISIGNLTVGGTGKTPLVIEVARRLRALGRRPAVLTRGYAAARGETADEVLEYRLAIPDVPVIANPDRVAGAAEARHVAGIDCLVLDDGFQHRRLRRALDIVVIDALAPWGNGWVLPAGRLREPLTSLSRADWIVITRTNQVDAGRVQELAAVLRHAAPEAPIMKAAIESAALVDAKGVSLPPSDLEGRCALLASGIGNPATFVRLVERLGAESCGQRSYSDHHRYTSRDVSELVEAAARVRADCVVTTRKDWVKLHPLWPRQSEPAAVPALLRLDARVALADPRGELDARLAQLFEEQA